MSQQRVSISPYRSGYISSQSLEEENAILRTKCKKVAELEEKVELVLKHNSQLLVENEKLSKLLHQHKTDYEVMKNKFEMVSSQRAGITSGQDFEIKKLLGENERLKLEIAELEHLKAAQINETRSQLHVELQNLKRQQLSNTEMYELEIRKLKDLLERKEYEIEESKNRVNRAYSESEYEVAKLREEKERLRSELTLFDAERKRESDAVRNKLEAYYLSEIEAIKKTHLANLEAIEFENMRLKDSLGAKNQEIESLLIKQQKLKQNLDESNSLLRSENEILKQKLIEMERLGELEFDSLKSKLQSVHESELGLIKQNHANFTACLQQEIDKLEGLVNIKNLEMEQLIKERGQTRQLHETEVHRLRSEIEVLLTKLGEVERTFDTTSGDLKKRLAEKEEHIEYLNTLNTTQSNKNAQELDSLRKLLAHKEEDLEARGTQSRQVELHLKESLAAANKEAQNLRDELQRVENQRTSELEDLKDAHELQIRQLNERLEGFTNKTNQSKKESDMLKESLDLKEKENSAVKKRLQSSEDAEKRYAKEIEELRTKLLNKDKENNKIVEELRMRLEKTFNYTLESLKADHANALKSERLKIAELEALLKKRENQLDDLLKRYKQLEEGFYALTNQEATKKELTLKFPGATADLMATKNLFDVFIKAKVLDLAGRPE